VIGDENKTAIQAPVGQTTSRLLVNSSHPDENPYPNGVYLQTTIAPRGAMQFKASSYQVAENGRTLRAFVSRTSSSFGAASVHYATSNGTAQAGSDYGATSGTLNWDKGDAADKPVDVLITDDSISEGDEYFTISLSSATRASLGAATATTVDILDNDSTNVRVTGMALSSGAVHFSANGPAGRTRVVQVSSNLANWSPLSTNTIPVGGSLLVNDSTAQRHRFYRASLP